MTRSDKDGSNKKLEVLSKLSIFFETHFKIIFE